MAMPQCCYLAKGAKRLSHTTNTIKFDRIPFDPCNSVKRFDLSPFDQKNSTFLQPPPHSHCNGTGYIVKSAGKHVIETIVATGTDKGNQLFIPRIVLTPSDNLFPFTMHRKQFPIRPDFSFTANNSQGQTLRRVRIYPAK